MNRVQIPVRSFFQPSRFAITAVIGFLGGIVIGSNFGISYEILLWLLLLWLFIAVSEQSEIITGFAISVSGFLLGWALWQFTGGESWLKIQGLERFSAILLAIRERAIDQIYLSLPQPHGSLLAGIIFGNRIGLPDDLLEIFRSTGLSHIIAVSGFHLSVITVAVQSVLRPLIFRYAIGATFMLLIVMILITGAPPSILRAATMASVGLIALYLGRPKSSINLLLLAMGILVLLEPKIIFQIGFQLSVAATYGIVRLAPLINWALLSSPLPRYLREIVSQTLAATLLTLPLLVWYFGQFSLISPVTNLLIIWLMPFLTVLGVALIVITLILPWASVILLTVFPPLAYVFSVAQYLSRVSFASQQAELPIYIIVAIMAIIVIFSEILGALNHKKLDSMSWPTLA